MRRSYWDGKQKRYASNGGYCVNLLQGKAERKAKYQTLCALGIDANWARLLRDWRIPNCSKWLATMGHEVDFALLVAERIVWNELHEEV